MNVIVIILPLLTNLVVNELYDFLDQDSDGEISLPELYYLQDLTKTIVSKSTEEKITLPLALQGLEEGTLKVKIDFNFQQLTLFRLSKN